MRIIYVQSSLFLLNLSIQFSFIFVHVLFLFVLMLSLRSGGPPLQSFGVLRAFNNYCCSILHTLFTTCHALWVNVDCSHAHHVAHSPKISPYLSCCYCRAELVSYLVNGLGNSCAGQFHQPNRRCFGRGSATAS